MRRATDSRPHDQGGNRDGLTVADLPDDLEDWWADYSRSLRRRDKSPQTIARYRASYVRFWVWALDRDVDAPDDVTRDHLHAWLDHLRDDQIQASTVAIYWRNLRPFFTWWAKELSTASPFKGADNPGEQDTPLPLLSVDDVRALLAACAGKTFEHRRDEAIIRVLYDTGVRLGELVGMTVEDWDRRADLITVEGKSRRARAVPLSPTTGEALARYLRLRAKHQHAEKSDALWLGRKGGLGGSGVAQLLARRSRQAGMDRVHPHQFRHTFSHEFRDAGGSEGDLMHLAGWTSTTMAHRYGRSAAEARAQRAHQRIRLGDQL